MQLDITRAIQNPGTEFPFDALSGHAPEDWNGDTLFFESPIHVSGTYFVVGDTAYVRGKVKVTLKTACASCLDDAQMVLETDIDEGFVRDEDKVKEDEFTYVGHMLFLDDLVMGAIYTHLPMRFLCKEDCKGICQSCYTNLNQATCSCPKELPTKHPFAALASLLNQDEEV